VDRHFEWDADKAEQNRRKHRVTFTEAVSTFADPLAVTVADPDHSDAEQRFVQMGISEQGRCVVVVYAERDGRIRLISARLATRHERRSYEG
jgi:hypothetical protein